MYTKQKKNTTGYENDDDSREQDKINLVSNRILSLNRRHERVRFLIKLSRYDKTDNPFPVSTGCCSVWTGDFRIEWYDNSTDFHNKL